MEPKPRRSRSGALGRKSQTQPPADQQRTPSASGRSRAVRDTGDARARERTQTPAGTKQAQPKKPAAPAADAPAPHTGAQPAAVKTKSSGSAVPEDSISRDVRVLIKESSKQAQAGVGAVKESLRATLMRLAGVCPTVLPLHAFPRKLPDALVLATREDRANGELFYATYVAQLSGKELEAMGRYVCSTHELAVYRLFQRYIDYIVDEGWIHAEAPTPFHWCRMGSCHEYFPTRSAASAHLLSCHGSWLRTTKDAAAREDEGVKTLIKTSVNLQRQTDAALAAVATQSAAVRAECERALLEDPPPECVLITPAIAARLAQPAHVFRHAGPPPPQLPRAGDSRFYASGSAPAPPFSPSTTVEDEEQAAESRRRDDREALHRETAIRDEAQRAAEARMAARLAEVEAAAERDRQTAERDRQTAERDRQTAERDRQTAERDRQAAEERIAALQADYARQREADREEYRRAMAAHLDQQATQVRQAAAAAAEAERLRMQALSDAEASAAQQQRAQHQQPYQEQTERAEVAQLRQELEAMRQHMQAQQAQQAASPPAAPTPAPAWSTAIPGSVDSSSPHLAQASTASPPVAPSPIRRGKRPPRPTAQRTLDPFCPQAPQSPGLESPDVAPSQGSQRLSRTLLQEVGGPIRARRASSATGSATSGSSARSRRARSDSDDDSDAPPVDEETVLASPWVRETTPRRRTASSTASAHDSDRDSHPPH